MRGESRIVHIRIPKCIYLESVVIGMLSHEMLNNLLGTASHIAWPTDSKLPLEVN